MVDNDAFLVDAINESERSTNFRVLPAVEAACAEAITHGVHSADVVLNILARQRDPAPPANIVTPAALTLRHAPIADCARYDNLRSIR